MSAEAGRLSVLHVAAPGRVGGLERVLQGLAIGHLRRGHDVHVAALLGRGASCEPFTHPLRTAGVPVHELEVSVWSVPTEIRFVRELCRRHGPQVVHTHGYRPDIVDGEVARRLGIPSVTTEHGMSRQGGRAGLYEWLQTRSFRRFDAVVAVSRPIETALRRAGVPAQRIHFVPNAWSGEVEFLEPEEARRALGIPMGAFVVGWVGRLIRAKGADVFLRALARVSELPLQATVFGEGRERPALEDLVKRLGIERRARLCGELRNAAAYFRAFDLFVLSSRTEGTPIALFEAMAAGVPVVATTVGGIPDVVTAEEALLVPPEDPSALAKALCAVYHEPEKSRARAARAAERLREHYAQEPWLRRYEEVYHAAVARRKLDG